MLSARFGSQGKRGYVVNAVDRKEIEDQTRLLFTLVSSISNLDLSSNSNFQARMDKITDVSSYNKLRENLHYINGYMGSLIG